MTAEDPSSPAPAPADSAAPDAIARLISRELPVVRLGTGLAGVALVAALLGLVLRPAGAAVGWPLAGLVVTGLLFLVCSIQLRGWTGARTDRARLAGRSAQVSFWAHVVSYPLVLVGMFAMLAVLVEVSFVDGRSVIMLFGVLALVLGQAMAATRFLRRSGPAGTIPEHLQRLRALERRRTEPPSDARDQQS